MSLCSLHDPSEEGGTRRVLSKTQPSGSDFKISTWPQVRLENVDPAGRSGSDFSTRPNLVATPTRTWAYRRDKGYIGLGLEHFSTCT